MFLNYWEFRLIKESVLLIYFLIISQLNRSNAPLVQECIIMKIINSNGFHT